MKTLENALVIIVCGDRDWVGYEAVIEDIQEDGSCKIVSGGAYYNSNIKYVQTTPTNLPNREFVLKQIWDDLRK
jgi:hypothetical protein